MSLVTTAYHFPSIRILLAPSLNPRAVGLEVRWQLTVPREVSSLSILERMTSWLEVNEDIGHVLSLQGERTA